MKTLLVTLILVSGQIASYAHQEPSNGDNDKKSSDSKGTSKSENNNQKDIKSDFIIIKPNHKKDFFLNNHENPIFEPNKDLKILFFNVQKNVELKIKEVLEPCPVFRPCD